MIKRINFSLKPPYIDKPLDMDTMKSCLESDPTVVYCVYCIKNSVKETIKFAEIEDQRYDLMAHVRVKYALVGDAKRQAWGIRPFSSLIKIKPEYTFVCILDDRKSNKLLYYKKYQTKNPKLIYDLVEESFQDLQILTNSFV